MIRATLTGHYSERQRYPVAMVNITNRCNLSCQHCFIYREGNPNEKPRSVRDEPSDAEMLETLVGLRDRHGISLMLWMGGEPLLRRRLLEKAVPEFQRNTITTNGTVPLIDFGMNALYVVSLDGPEDLNDAIRGAGSYRRVFENLARLPADFTSPVQAQCVVTRRNQHRLEEFVESVMRGSSIGWVTFSFYVPCRGEAQGPDAWSTNEERAAAVHEVLRLKAAFPGFVRNSTRSLELMLPPAASRVTAACPAQGTVLPLWLDGDGFVTPFCCYGNDVDCERCGAWVVFALAARSPADRFTPAAEPASARHPR